MELWMLGNCNDLALGLLDGDFDTGWFPMKALIERRLQLGLSTCVADATHAVVAVVETKDGLVLARRAMIRRRPVLVLPFGSKFNGG